MIEPFLEEIREPDWHGTPAELASTAYAEERSRAAEERWKGVQGGGEPPRDFVERVRDITHGKLCDVVYDGVGRATFPASLDCLRPMGMFVSFGSASGPIDAFDIGLLTLKGSLYVTRPSLFTYIAKRKDYEAMAEDTLALMRQMVEDGEVDHLVPERVWQELSRGLIAMRPSRMFEVLRESGALRVLLPELDRLWGVPQRAEHHPEIDTGVHVMMVVDYAASQNHPLDVRFAALTHDLGKAATPKEELPRHHGHEERSVGLVKALCERLRVPTECRDLALVMAREHGNIHRTAELRANTIVKLLQSVDAFRKPERFARLLLACESDKRGRLGGIDRPYPPAARMAAALQAAASVDAGVMAKQVVEPEAIKEKIYQARVAAVKTALREQDE